MTVESDARAPRPGAGPAAATAARKNREGALAVWCTLWLVLGIWTGYEVWQLAALSDTVAASGRTLDQAGAALESLDSVPVVGDETAELGSSVRANAGDIVESAQSAEASVRRLSILLGLAVALLPSVPVLVVYLLARRPGSLLVR